MKLTIIKTLTPDDRYPDADTGRPDTDNKQASEPVRVLPAPEPAPEPVPELEPKPVGEDDLHYIRKVLAINFVDLKVQHLAPLIGTTDEKTTMSMIRRGDDYVLNYYAERKQAERQAAWAERQKAWAKSQAAWEQNEMRRQASLMFWVFRNKVVKVEGWETASREEVVARVTHKVLSEEKAFAKLKREIDLFEKLEKTSPLSREPMPEDVRIFVWRRDEGRCVRCGSQERIEFDHIIPLEKGGSNTARNIQVLCERCNREKGTTV